MIMNGKGVNKIEYDFEALLFENIYLILGLLIGIIALILMRNTINSKP